MKSLNELENAIKEIGGTVYYKSSIKVFCYRYACQGCSLKVKNGYVTDDDFNYALEVVLRTSRPANLI